MTTTPDIEELIAEIKAGMEGVTPGPWHWINSDNDLPISVGDWRGDLRTVWEEKSEYGDYTLPKWILSVDEFGEGRGDDAQANLAHIARCSPDNITTLIDAYEAVKAERDARPTDNDMADMATRFRAVNVGEALSKMGVSLETLQDWQHRAEAAEARVAELTEALNALVDETCDYAKINNLGDPEDKHSVKRARAALAGREEG